MTPEEKYKDTLISIDMFRFFLYKIIKAKALNDKDIESIRIDFAEYLHNLNMTHKQLENVIPKNDIDIITNRDHPFRIEGFPAAYTYHFTEYVRIKTKGINQEHPNINKSFNMNAKTFITEIYNLDQKDIPDLSIMDNQQISQLYGDTLNDLTDRLMHHRNKPLDQKYIDSLYNLSYTPKSIKIILESFKE